MEGLELFASALVTGFVYGLLGDGAAVIRPPMWFSCTVPFDFKYGFLGDWAAIVGGLATVPATGTGFRGSAIFGLGDKERSACTCVFS